MFIIIKISLKTIFDYKFNYYNLFALVLAMFAIYIAFYIKKIKL